MNVIVYGAGALGSFFGGLLSTQHQVTLVGRPAHVQAVKREGLRISGETSLVAHPATVTSLSEAPDAVHSDLVLLTVKAFHTRQAVEDVAAHTSAPLLSLQNGLGNEEAIAEGAGEGRALGGVTTHGVLFVEPGHVRHTGSGDTIVGELDGSLSPRVRRIADGFSAAGIPTLVSSDIRRDLWRKALVNAAINPLSAVLRCKNGYLLENPHARRVMEDVCEEGSAVARAAGIDVGQDVMDRVTEVATHTRENLSSMLQSLLAGKRTEIDHINGVIVSRGREEGISTPVNATLISIVRALEMQK
ncbi:MAG: 2-dehydropantoate 2-reductase [Candidatus Thermoplasmatota archaeon]|nr:2-dehydropantoate 2-reductase [Candidatus Thermoplasmatota archaeon]